MAKTGNDLNLDKKKKSEKLNSVSFLLKVIQF